jgi:hypothetical protein
MFLSQRRSVTQRLLMNETKKIKEQLVRNEMRHRAHKFFAQQAANISQTNGLLSNSASLSFVRRQQDAHEVWKEIVTAGEKCR